MIKLNYSLSLDFKKRSNLTIVEVWILKNDQT